MTTFRQLLDHFEDSAKTRAAKGKRFEDFIEAYLRTDPIWTEQFDRIWSWQDWPGRDEGHPDTGIDLVAREAGTGRTIAIQCKFYSPDATLSWQHVSTFAGMLGQPDFDAGMLISTAGSESDNVWKNLDKLEKQVVPWRVEDFETSRISWSDFVADKPLQLTLKEPKQLRPHQEKAIGDVVDKFDLHDRGQLVMACGTGKTFTSLRLAEQMVGAGGSVLFLVPSINLLSQGVRAWANDAVVPLATFAVCSDAQAGKRTKDEDISLNDLSFPASTDVEGTMAAIEARSSAEKMTVVFSTYQSIDVITACQENGLDEFDLIICDEAHRTTGAFKDAGDDRSAFTKVHEDQFVRGAHRLYMTATPRVYGDQTKAKAQDSDVIVASMDDEDTFGPVFHELTFGDAVAQQLLTDYKVLVLAVNEDEVSAAFQKQLANADGELALDDVAKIVGCWHGLSKRGPQFGEDRIPMRRAVAFSSTIKQSKAFMNAFPLVVNEALQDRSDSNAVMVETQHVDGSHNVKIRSEAIHWLEEPPGQRVCRVLSNAKCLTEGVDVPALDAVLFLQSRKSIVDVVQAVGRVMRLNEGKDFGYVILPIGVPAGVAPAEALKDNKKYQVVWQVLQALRSHDERLAAEINKIDVNKSSGKVGIIGIGLDGGDDPSDPGVTTTPGDADKGTLELPELGEWCDALYAKIVEKVGDRKYMDHWAADIQAIAQAQETRIRSMLDHPEMNPAAVERFDEFLIGLRNNLNDSISRDDAIGMLSQHLITRPVFEALFGGDEFTKHNPVSKVMQGMIDTLDDAHVASETATLEGFYNHIRMLIGGIDSADGRQRVITELYEKFFKKALPKTADALGIVYTPIEIVDFINRAVNDLIAEHFDGASLSDEGVHVLDPFAGTGTFVARMLQTGLIRPEDLERKYRSELHCNELMLLAYYIAAINIEAAYAGARGAAGDYTPFDGIVLTDTFQMSEEGDPLDTYFFPQNNARAEKQLGLEIRVIVGNPPYSIGQADANDNNQNLSYPSLDRSIEETFGSLSTSGNVRSLYDSYVRALRWASTRIGTAGGGIVGFVTNGGWLDGKSADGIRKSFVAKFDHIYVFKLRGNQKAEWRKEGEKVFGEGSQVTVAIVFLVRRAGGGVEGSARIRYYEVADGLTRGQKLEELSVSGIENVAWREITPNEEADWLSVRHPGYEAGLVPLDGEVFRTRSYGLVTNRDAWVYNSDGSAVERNATRMADFFNGELARRKDSGTTVPAEESVDTDPTKYKWTRGHYKRLENGQPLAYSSTMRRVAQYRPFFKQELCFDSAFNEMPSKLPALFPRPDAENLVIAIKQQGPAPFFALASHNIVDLVVGGAGNPVVVYSRWTWNKSDTLQLIPEESGRISNIAQEGLERFRGALGSDVSEDAVFFYVYGVLHSPEFRQTFAVNLNKAAPRVPLVGARADFDAFAVAGKELCDLHVGYEEVAPYPLVEEWVVGADPDTDPKVLLVGSKKMKYPKVKDVDSGKQLSDKTRLIYNDYLTLSSIPLEAHDYVLGTRSGIDWIIDRYYVKTDKASRIVNDVNQWGLERGEPRYIIDLIKRVVSVSLRTVEIVNSLPTLDFGDLA